VYKYFNPRFDKVIMDISPGEYIATDEDVVLSTVLGSCVSVVIYDSTRNMSGINHFMLVEGKGMGNLGDVMLYERYGTYAMETLLNEFIRSGSDKKSLQAKVFGGSRILYRDQENINDIGEKNIIFAMRFLKNEDIPIVASDTGGERPRRLFVYPRTFKVFLKKEKKEPPPVADLQKTLPARESRIVLFDT
jgi:chemotaxis protein CheD